MKSIKSKEELQLYVNSGNRVKYLFFWGHQEPDSGFSKACLSQWYDSPFEIDGHTFLTAEHYMMHRKAQLFNDLELAKKIIQSTNPGKAKELGRSIRGFDETLWNEHRLNIVVEGNLLKFQQHPPLKDYLLSTGDRVLVEASPVDRIWGIGLAADNHNAQNPNLWRGLNLLGFALMEVRKRLA